VSGDSDFRDVRSAPEVVGTVVGSVTAVDPGATASDSGDDTGGDPKGAGGPPNVTKGDPKSVENDAKPRFSKPALIATGVLALLILGLAVALFATSPTQQAAISSRTLVGKAAPPIVADTLNGGTFNLSHHQATWVVVSFYASWCPGCVLEIRELEEFQERRGDQNVVVATVVFNDTREKVEDSLAEALKLPVGDVPWPVVFGEQRSVTADIALDYGVVGLPETFVISPQGLVVEKFIGAAGVTADSLDQAILKEIQRQDNQQDT